MSRGSDAGQGPAVRLGGLTKRYGRNRGVESLTLEVARGEVLGFLGPNGAGKSTTIRLVMGLSRPNAGSVQVLGGSPREVAVRRRIGYLPGELRLFPALSGRDLLDRLAHIHGGVSAVDIDSLAARLGAELDRPLRALSKGNRQKIGLVLAFMHRPELLVLDEPTSGLDPLLQDEFARLIRERVADGATVFLSSHDLDEVERVVDRVAIIREGRLVAVDTVSGLRERAPRVVQLHLDHVPAQAVLAAIPGVRVIDRRGDGVSLEVNGSMAPLLRAIGDMGATDLVARPAGLDEIFRAFYRGTDVDEGPLAS
ncbi:ABC-2 type transport system ATP-binding protein [Pedococcus dokdonensis]|uniref:ABC-2 type transport system ATP-binding protein n=1 Tax=Pedococcus dokdonensis TaxID=443156 RepID=A0A1H0SIW7_9MICO|nr:ABC transporter ATP-binding protein [Pedococcus dokdonensis]SDP41086.1 ABC-2 type transport system ATP-binding protein [Pedococcus dokdonensis]